MFTDLQPGTYDVVASMPATDQAWTRRHQVEVPPGGGVAKVDLVFGADEAIGGTLLGASGSPLEGGVMTVTPQAGRAGAVANTVSGQGGRFHFHDLAPGMYRIGVQVPPDVRAREGPIRSAGTSFRDIAAGRADLNLELPEAKGVIGFLLDSNETLVRGAFVAALAGGDVVDWTRTDEQGRFELRGVGELVEVTAVPAVEDASHPEGAVPDIGKGRRIRYPHVSPGTVDLVLRFPFALD